VQRCYAVHNRKKYTMTLTNRGKPEAKSRKVGFEEKAFVPDWHATSKQAKACFSAMTFPGFDEHGETRFIAFRMLPALP
jgi:hypothetical protein